MKSTSRLSSPLAAAIFALLAGQSAQAQTTWDGGGGDDNWGTGANWVGDVVPTPGTTADLIFAGTTRLTPVFNYTDGDDFRDITFAAGAGAFTIANTGTNGIDWFGSIINNSSNTQNIGFRLYQRAANSIQANTGDITLNSSALLFRNSQSLTLSAASGRLITLQSVIADGSGAGGSIVLNGAGSVRFAAANTFTSGIAIDSGTAIASANNAALGTGTAFVGNGGASFANTNASLLINQSGLTIANAITTNKADTGIGLGTGTRTIGGNFTSGSSTFSGNISLNGGAVLTTGSGGTVIFDGIIQNGVDTGNVSRAVTINASGGTIQFNKINTYTGTTTINAGTVEVKAGTAGGSAVWGSGGITLSQGATLYFNPTAQAIQNTSGFTVSGPITLSGGAGTANIRFAGNDNKFALSGGVTGQAGVAQTFAITQGASGGTGDRQNILFTGAIADGSGGTLGVSVDFAGGSSAAQSGFVNLRGQNTFTGNLTVTNSKGLNAGGTYPGAWLTIGGERYNGFSAPTATTVGTGFLGAGADYSGNISISNGAGLTTLGFLTSANQQLNGVISGTGSLHQGGSGTLTLTNANNFTGGTTIAAGTLQLSTGGSLADTGAITVSGGIFGIQTVSDTVGTVTLTSGSITGTSGVLSASSYAVQSGTASAILGGGNLTKTTAGTVTLSGANTFSGTTTVSAGTLTLDYSTQDNSKLSNSAALILGGGTVSLSGGTHTEVVASITLQAGTTSNITRPSGASVLQLGTVTANPGASLNLGASGIATTNNTNNSLGVLGSWATISGSGWAVKSTNGANGLITAATYTDVTRLSSGIKTIASSAGNYRIIEGTGIVADVTMAAGGTTSVNTLVNNSTTVGTVAVGTGNTLSTGAILQSTGAGTLTIGTFGATAGSLSALSAGGNLGVVANSVNGVIINSVISDNATSTLTKDGAGIVTLTGANTYTGTTTVNAGVLAVGLNLNGVGGDNISPDGTSTSLGSGAVSVAAGAALHINTAGLTIANNITLNGLSYGVNSGGPTATNSGPWNGALMGNSKTGVTSNTFSGTITLNATSNVSTNWNDKTMIITGKVTGAGGLVIDNSAPGARRGGLIRLNNTTNDYAGDTTINNGNTAGAQPTLILGASNVIPDGAVKGNLVVLGNLNLNSFSETINGLSGSGVINNGVGSTISTLTVGNNNATGLTYSGTLQNGTGTVALAKTGNGTQTLSGTSITYTGNTGISTGTLVLSQTTGYASGTTTVSGTLELTSTNTGVDNWRVNSILAGAGTINKTGAGWIQTNNNANTFSGTVNIQQGAFGASFLNSNWTGVTADFNISSNALLDARGQAITVGSLNGAGNVGTTWNSAATVTVGAANKSGNFSGSIRGSGGASTNDTANPSAGVLSLVKNGSGSQILSGTNTYSGGTTINTGTIDARNSSALGSGSVSVAAGAKLFLNANSLTIANNITLNGPTTNGAIYSFQPGAGVTTNLTGTLTLNATSNISFWWNDKTLQLSGKITGAGGLDFVLQPGAVGGRYLISGATNDYAGATSVTGNASSIASYTGQAMLYLRATNALPTTTALTLNNADLYLNGQSQTLPSISGTGTFAVQNGSTTAATLTLGSGNTTSTFSGTIKDNGISVTNTSSTPTTVTGTVALTKIGNGTLTLSTTNAYTGATNVSEGILLVNGSTAVGSTVSIASGATLGGTGTIGGAVNVTGSLSPGASIETLGTGTLSFVNNSTLVHELNSSVADSVASDLLKVTGNLNLTGTVGLSLSDLAVTDVAFNVGDIFSLINYTGTWNNGLFTFIGNELADEEQFTYGLNLWRISYNDTTGGLNYTGEHAVSSSFVNLHAIPEPRAALLGGLGMLMLLRRRRH